MQAYVLNLDTANDRWRSVEEAFGKTEFRVRRIPAVNGSGLALPLATFAQARYRLLHGRTTNLREVGCYLSHIKACETFLESGEPHGLIVEDDIALEDGFETALKRAMDFSQHWNVLRVAGLTRAKSVGVSDLGGGYSLCVNLGRLKGAGAYVIDRAAARIFVSRLLPMWLPFDHAIDREWFFGLRAASILPFPVSQTQKKFRTSIQSEGAKPLSFRRRCLTTYPYQAMNEVTRWCARGVSAVQASIHCRWAAR